MQDLIYLHDFFGNHWPKICVIILIRKWNEKCPQGRHTISNFFFFSLKSHFSEFFSCIGHQQKKKNAKVNPDYDFILLGNLFPFSSRIELKGMIYPSLSWSFFISFCTIFTICTLKHLINFFISKLTASYSSVNYIECIMQCKLKRKQSIYRMLITFL